MSLRLPGDLWSDREARHAAQERLGAFFLSHAKSSVHFRDAYRAAGQDGSLVEQLGKEFRAAIASVEVIEENGGIEKKVRHQRLVFRRMASSKRSWGSDRIFSTCVAGEAISTGGGEKGNRVLE